MDSATILVIVLTAGGIALLVWFELNSRRNQRESRESRPMQIGSPGSTGSDKAATARESNPRKAA